MRAEPALFRDGPEPGMKPDRSPYPGTAIQSIFSTIRHHHFIFHGRNEAMTRHYYHVSDEALTSAIRALPAIGAASTPGTPATPPHDRITAFKALLAEMTADEREEARRILAG